MADVSLGDSKPKVKRRGGLTKKRVKNPEEWNKQKQKRLRIAGKEYINSNGKVIPPKTPGPDCHCRRKCYTRVPESVRINTFNGYYAMKNHDEQNAYLFGLMRQIDVKRKRKKSSSRRTCTFEYFVRVKGRETQVCQTAFKNIHAITERKVRVLCKKMDDGVMFPCDNRGKNSHKRAGEIRLPNSIVNQVKHHIYSIVHTHRLKDFIRLDARLEINISKMWKDYIKNFEPFNIEFTLPKSKRNINQTITTQQAPPQSTQQTYTEVNYSGHLVNLTDNYFNPNQYQPTITTVSTPSYYSTQSAPIILQSSTQASAYIVLQAKHEPGVNHTYNVVEEKPKVNENIKKEASASKRRTKGPYVKQWRYTCMFHEEINGAVLAAIKTRLDMYYSESDAGKKKTKQRVVEQTSNSNIVNVTAQNIESGHTVTIYT